MSDTAFSQSALLCPLPPASAGEPDELRVFRESPEDERAFLRLRRRLRDDQDWSSMATLMVLHAAHHDKPEKVAELSAQAGELCIDRVKDPKAAAHAFARAVLAMPENERYFERLRALYRQLNWPSATADLLRWKIETVADGPPQERSSLHLELAAIYQNELLAIPDAISNYEQALALTPGDPNVGDALIQLYLQAGAWSRAIDTMNDELNQSDIDDARVSQLNLQLGRIELEEHRDLPNAARYFQAAIKAAPNSLDALLAFGQLYVDSGKATDEGKQKASGIFLKAAGIARSQENPRRALQLLRHSLALNPDLGEAATELVSLLREQELWQELDDYLKRAIHSRPEAESVDNLLIRAELLEQQLSQREEARICYERAAPHQPADGSAYQALKRIYTDIPDWHALAGLYETQLEQIGESIATETLLHAAEIYRDHLDDDARAAHFYFKVLEHEPFNAVAFEGYKEYFRRRHNWSDLRDLILYQIEQAAGFESDASSPYADPQFAEEFVELADICERRLGDVDGALNAWGRLAVAYPNDGRAHSQIARIEKRTRMWDNMVRVQEAELDRTSDTHRRLDILKRLAQIHKDRDINPARAIFLYTEILNLSPGDLQATRALTALYDRDGQYTQVVTMLREQVQRSKSNTERVSLLRRMSEISHHELNDSEGAIWACNKILSLVPKDLDALHRLQMIQGEQEDYESLFGSLQRELGISKKDRRGALLRRMAQVAELELQDQERAARVWYNLLEIEPNNLEIVDKMISVYEFAHRHEELSALLNKASAAAQTPSVRKLDYLLRLGALALGVIDDSELAKDAYERVLSLRTDHRGAVEALAQIYRDEQNWDKLVAVLERLQELVDTDDEVFLAGWERAEILLESLHEPKKAGEVLSQLAKAVRPGNRELNEKILSCHRSAGHHRALISHAERMLLGTPEADSRRHLFALISEAWIDLGDNAAALAAHNRLIDETEDELDKLDNLIQLADLQEKVGEPRAALDSLERVLLMDCDSERQLGLLCRMADTAEQKLDDSDAALAFLRRALRVDPEHAALLERLNDFAASHDRWTVMVDVADFRFDHFSDLENHSSQLELCLETSALCEEKLGELESAFNWARRGYFLSGGIDTSDAMDRLRALAQRHGLWEDLLAVTEQELSAQTLPSPTNDDAQKSAVTDESIDDTIDQLLASADIAEHQLKNPKRAIDFLLRALFHRPDDTDILERIEDIARTHELWQALLSVSKHRLGLAETDLAIFDIQCAIAKLHELQLASPKDAFASLRAAWLQIESRDGALSEELIEMMFTLAERNDLWLDLAEHHAQLAYGHLADGHRVEGLDALLEAAEIVHDKLDDTLASLRMLLPGVAFDTDGDTVVPRIHELTLKLDATTEQGASDGERPKIGGLIELRANASQLRHAKDTEQRIQLLRRRADIRETRLGDGPGAFAEWTRVLGLAPDSSEAREELRRIAGEFDLWNLYLLLPAWELERTQETSTQADLYLELATIYEDRIDRPEFALRARIEAWRRQSTLPVPGELDDVHGPIWRLCGDIGDYKVPALPHDPLLEPKLRVPEERDLERWKDAGQDPLQTLVPPRPSAQLHPSPIAINDTEPLDLDELDGLEFLDPEGLPPRKTLDTIADEDSARHPLANLPSDVADLFEEIEEVEEIDDVSEPPKPDLSAGTTSPSGPRTSPPPPPTTTQLAAGLPRLLSLRDRILPARPRVPSAWDELAASYAQRPVAGKEDKIATFLVLARLWEHGAQNVDRAFRFHEQALLLIPEHEQSLTSLLELTARHFAHDRLVQSLELLLGEAALPEHVVSQSLRIAQIHQQDGDFERAELRYKGVLAVVHNHVDALRSLLKIYEDDDERRTDYVETFAKLLTVERDELTDDERITRTLRLAGLYDTWVDQGDTSLDLLRALVRDFPASREVQEPLISMLLDGHYWPQAIDVMRSANNASDDATYCEQNLARIAKVYTDELKLPDRAIETWVLYRQTRPGEDDARAQLQALYLETSRYEHLLPILDARLDDLRGYEEHRDLRIELLITKARALQDGLDDEQGATRTLEQLIEEAPENDEVILALSQLYRTADRIEEGVDLLRSRIDAIEDQETFVRYCATLTEALFDDAHDPAGAFEVLQAGLERFDGNELLLQLQAKLARVRNDLSLLVSTLSKLGSHDGHLEAADIARQQLGDSGRATRLYARVLAASKSTTSDDTKAARLTRAVEGLVQLRIDSGDTEGAIQFMDEQLSEVDDPRLRARLLTEMGLITYRATGQLDSARERFDAALRDDPEYAPAKNGLARILFEDGRIDDAEQLATAAVEALTLASDQAHLVDALVLLAQILESTGRIGEAYRRLSTALRHDSDNLGIRRAIVHNRLGAKRWRDALTAADQLEQRISTDDRRLEGNEPRLAGDIFAMAAACEHELKQESNAFRRLRRALDVDPSNEAALEAIIPHYQQSGDLVSAAKNSVLLAEATQDPHHRGARFIDAGVFSHEATRDHQSNPDKIALATSEPQLTVDELNRQAFECIRIGLSLVEDSDKPVLDETQVEIAFRASVGHDATIALACLDRLLLRADISDQHRADLLLEGARIAVEEVSSAHEERQTFLDRAESYARAGMKLMPTSSAAVLALAAMLEASGRTDELEPLVAKFLESLHQGRTENGHGTPEDIVARLTLLFRLAALQSDQRPDLAVRTLEQAIDLAPEGVGLPQRVLLADLYDRTMADKKSDRPSVVRVIDNHEALIQADPVARRSLRVLAEHHRANNDLPRALALFEVLALLAGGTKDEDPSILEFVESHCATLRTAKEELNIASVTVESPRSAGIPLAIKQLWEAGAGLLSGSIQKFAVDPEARVSPVADSPLGRSWSTVLKRLGPTKVSLIDDPGLEFRGDKNFFRVRCQQPPVVLTGPAARGEQVSDYELQFALARAHYFARPEFVVLQGLDRQEFSSVLSATLQAFHPRHIRRKHHARGDAEATAKLSQELTRKLPIRVARQLSGTLKEAENDQFDSRVWRDQVWRNGNRIGLTVCGHLKTSLEVVGLDSRRPLADQIADNHELRDLLAFAVSAKYPAARSQLGWQVAEQDSADHLD